MQLEISSDSGHLACVVRRFPCRLHIKNGLYHVHPDGSIRYVHDTTFDALRILTTTVFCGPLETDITMPCRHLDSVCIDGYDARVGRNKRLEFFAVVGVVVVAVYPSYKAPQLTEAGDGIDM